MSAADATPLEVVTSFNEALGRRDWNAFAALLGEDLSYTTMSFDLPGGGVPMDRATVLATLPGMVDQLFAPGSPRLEITHVTTDGEWLVAELDGTGEFVTGAEYRNRYANVYQVRDGLIRTVREYMDTGHMAKLFSELPQPG
jgi:uncharacterized protein